MSKIYTNNVMEMWADYSRKHGFDSRKINNSDKKYEEFMKTCGDSFIKEYIETYAVRYGKKRRWIVDIFDFILNFLPKENHKEYAYCLMKNAVIKQETWDFVLAHNPKFIELYFWSVEGKVIDETVDALKYDGAFEYFVDGLSIMLKELKDGIENPHSTLTYEMEEFYRKCAYNMYVYFRNGKVCKWLEEWNSDLRVQLEQEYLPFLEECYCA